MTSNKMQVIIVIFYHIGTHEWCNVSHLPSNSLFKLLDTVQFGRVYIFLQITPSEEV